MWYNWVGWLLYCKEFEQENSHDIALSRAEERTLETVFGGIRNRKCGIDG